MISKIVYIYALKDNEDIFYVGQTKNPHRRLRDHRSDSKELLTDKDRRISDILKSGRKLSFSILGTCLKEDGNKRELEAITAPRRSGHSLINKTNPTVNIKPFGPKIKYFSKYHRSIIQLMADDLTTADIAKELYRSTRTIETSIRKIKLSLGVKTKGAAIYKALKSGMIH
jgi:DNA-binding NarL/FixJ family response regulator